MKGCALLMKGVYCYLFIHWLLYTINPFGINRKQQMLWRRNSKTKYLELTEGYIYRLVPKPHSVWCLFLMQIEVSGKRVPWWGCWSWSQTPCCLLSSAAAMKKESLNHSTLSHAHCGLRELPWRRGALADSCGGPRHRASAAAPLCLLGLKQSLQNVVSSCSEKLRRGMLLPDPSEPSTHLRLKCAAAAGLTHQLRLFSAPAKVAGPHFSSVKSAQQWGLWAYPLCNSANWGIPRNSSVCLKSGASLSGDQGKQWENTGGDACMQRSWARSSCLRSSVTHLRGGSKAKLLLFCQLCLIN